MTQKTLGCCQRVQNRGIFQTLDAFDCRLFLHTKQTGSYLTVGVTTVTGTVLLVREFRDFLFACYNFTLPKFRKKYVG